MDCLFYDNGSSICSVCRWAHMSGALFGRCASRCGWAWRGWRGASPRWPMAWCPPSRSATATDRGAYALARPPRRSHRSRRKHASSGPFTFVPTARLPVRPRALALSHSTSSLTFLDKLILAEDWRGKWPFVMYRCMCNIRCVQIEAAPQVYACAIIDVNMYMC